MGGGSASGTPTRSTGPARVLPGPQWSDLADWERELAPHYETAERMLGRDDRDRPTTRRRSAVDASTRADRASRTPTPRPASACSSASPARPSPTRSSAARGRTAPGACAAARAWSAAATTPRTPSSRTTSYFAERAGVTILPERTVIDVRRSAPDGYQMTHGSSESMACVDGQQRLTRRRRRRRSGHAGVQQAALPLQGERLAPAISDRLGYLVRTNSESILAVTARGRPARLHRTVWRSPSSIYPDPDTHIEPVTYGRHADSHPCCSRS